MIKFDEKHVALSEVMDWWGS